MIFCFIHFTKGFILNCFVVHCSRLALWFKIELYISKLYTILYSNYYIVKAAQHVLWEHEMKNRTSWPEISIQQESLEKIYNYIWSYIFYLTGSIYILRHVHIYIYSLISYLKLDIPFSKAYIRIYVIYVYKNSHHIISTAY